MKKIYVLPFDIEKLERGDVVIGYDDKRAQIKVVKVDGKIMSFNEPQNVKPYTKINFYEDEKDVPLNLGKAETDHYRALKVGQHMTVTRSAGVRVVDGDASRPLKLQEQKLQGNARVITLERTPDGHEPKIIEDTGAKRTYLEEFELGQ